MLIYQRVCIHIHRYREMSYAYINIPTLYVYFFDIEPHSIKSWQYDIIGYPKYIKTAVCISSILSEACMRMYHTSIIYCVRTKANATLSFVMIIAQKTMHSDKLHLYKSYVYTIIFELWVINGVDEKIPYLFLSTSDMEL